MQTKFFKSSIEGEGKEEKLNLIVMSLSFMYFPLVLWRLGYYPKIAKMTWSISHAWQSNNTIIHSSHAISVLISTNKSHLGETYWYMQVRIYFELC